MITIDKKTCAGCQRCCHGKPGTILNVHLQESTQRPTINKDHRCEFLNSRNNCYLSKCHSKPTKCDIYPIVIANGEVFVDMACPAWMDAVKQWDEQFGQHIDDYNDGRDDHKFVNLWIAQSQMEVK